MNGLPYYKAYPRDFFEGTIGMTLELKGAYRLLLDLIYMHGGVLADEPRFISGHLGCSVRAWNGHRSSLLSMGKIKADLGIISNFRADKELESLGSFREKQRQNASKPRKNNTLHQAVAKPKSSHTDTEPYIEEKEEPIGSKKKPSKAISLPPDWVPSQRNLSDARDRNFTEDQINEHSTAFRDYHLARGTTFKDWDAAWRTWLGNARRFDRPSGPRYTGNRSPHDVMLSGFQRAAGGKPI